MHKQNLINAKIRCLKVFGPQNYKQVEIMGNMAMSEVVGRKRKPLGLLGIKYNVNLKINWERMEDRVIKNKQCTRNM